MRRVQGRHELGGLLRWLAGLSLLALAACAGAEGTHHHRHRRPLLDDEPEPTPVKLEPWAAFGTLGAMIPVGEPRRSNHRLGDEVAMSRVNERAAGYVTLRDLPEGGIVVESLGPSADAPPSVLFAMEKRAPGWFPEGGDFEYLVLEPNGTVLARGPLRRCARCHAEAPHGFVFGPHVLTAPGTP
jgi:hypothetical protein